LDHDESRPSEGDASICFYCGALQVFAADLSLRPPTAEESAALQEDVTVRAAVHAVKQRSKSNGH
jgi:hypothetical protein